MGGGRMGPGHRLRQKAMSHHPSSARPSSGTHLQGDAAVGQLLLQVHLNNEVPSLRELWERGGFGAVVAQVLCTSPLPRGWGWHLGELELGFSLKVMDDGETRGGEGPSPNVWPHHGEVWDSRDPEHAAGCVPIHPTSPGPCCAEGQRIPSTWVSFQVVIRLFSSSIWDTWSSSICQRKKG